MDSSEVQANPVSVSWYCVCSGACDAAFNMALDEALLELVSGWNRPVLRFYGWKEAAASFGYFQHFHDVEQLTALRPLVRRPTGGGIVPHDFDWTYSLAFPPEHGWYEFTATESYRYVHQWIQRAFAHLGFDTLLAAESLKTQPGCCFAGHEKSDLLWQGRKIAGAAQRRRKDGLLIQGSVQAPVNQLKRGDWEQAMRDVAGSIEPVVWSECPELDRLKMRATELERAKYARGDYTQQR
jgi:lipoate-protein ligase A